MSQLLKKDKNTLFDFLSKEQKEKLGIKDKSDDKSKSTKPKKQ